jgi:hypothetical protein
MNKQIDSPELKYAVIEALWTEGRREWIVIAYADEQSLCDLIAARSIVALGFASREKAAASIENCSPLSPASKQMARTVMVKGIRKYQQVVYSAKRRLADGFILSKSRRIAFRAMQQILAAAILGFYSRNAVSATIRTCLGPSFW